jgi:hypothetical protein
MAPVTKPGIVARMKTGVAIQGQIGPGREFADQEWSGTMISTTRSPMGLAVAPGSSRRRTRLARRALSILAAPLLAGVLTSSASAVTYPSHELEYAACGGGGNYGAAADYIEPRDPVIYAQNLKLGVAERQLVAWHVRLNRWTGTTWIVDPEMGSWSAWTTKVVVDGDGDIRYVSGAYSVPSGVYLKVPRLGTYYAVTFQVAWSNPVTGAWTYGPVKWSSAHANLINGNTWISDASLGFFGCRYILDQGVVSLPSPHL